MDRRILSKKLKEVHFDIVFHHQVDHPILIIAQKTAVFEIQAVYSVLYTLVDQIFIRRHRPVFCEAFIQINLKHAVRYTSEKPRFSLVLAFLDPKIYYAPEQLFRVTDKNSRRVYQLLSFIDRILSGFNGSGKG